MMGPDGRWGEANENMHIHTMDWNPPLLPTRTRRPLAATTTAPPHATDITGNTQSQINTRTDTHKQQHP